MSILNQVRLLLPVQAFELRPSTGNLYDLSAFLLGQNGKVRSDDDFVFYGQRTHPEGALSLHGNVPPEQTNDIWVDLTRVSGEAMRIAFVLSFYPDGRKQPADKNCGFDLQIGNGPRRTGETLLTICLPHTPAEDSTVLVGQLLRSGSRWEFAAAGELCQAGLKEACQTYGVDAE